MKKTVCLLLALLLLLSCAGSALAEGDAPGALSEAEQSAIERLKDVFVAMGEGLVDDNSTGIETFYTDVQWKSIADSFPARFDLRERGVVTPVKMQNPWGTCWSFGTVAASETSILSSLNLTTEEFAKQRGYEMDLSEKHLAWFSANALPDEIGDEQDASASSQAGEGIHLFEGVERSPYNLGGNFTLATSSLASGIGILKESVVPYQSSEGTLSAEDDWTLPEEMRFAISFELKDANVLPCPAGGDADGNYEYHPEGTESIKSELLQGRAVGIGYCADQFTPEKSPEEIRKSLEETLKDNKAVTEEEKAFYIDVRAGSVDPDTLTDEQLRDLIRTRCRLNSMDENLYDLSDLTSDDLRIILKSKFFSQPIEQLLESEKKQPYIVYFGSDPVISAQYTYESMPVNHAVCVVGWDDSFSAENFPEGYRPPADGAWIVKNSWSEDWGTNGYFYLSYYDKTINTPQTFTYVTSEDSQKLSHLEIMQFDFMPPDKIHSTLFDTPVYSANIFQTEEDGSLQYVSTMTGDLDTLTTISIYLLDEDAQSPVDGILLESVTQECPYAGYHRVDLPQNLALDAGARIGVVAVNRVSTDDGVKYALVNTSAASRKGIEDYMEARQKDYFKYHVGVINRGESFVCFDADRWMDWRDVVDSFEGDEACARLAYDNLPIKAYTYPLDEIIKTHSFDTWARTAGEGAAICTDCGYMLVFSTPHEKVQ